MFSSHVFADRPSRKHDLSQVPQYYPEVFQQEGIIQDLDKSDKVIVVNARKYKLADGIKVHTLRDEYGSINSLKTGANIAFKVANVEKNESPITEIWILPKSGAILH